MARQKREIYEIDEAKIIENIGGIKGNETKYHFATRLNWILKEKGITQQELYNITKIADGSISSYRNGKSEPSITNLCKIAKGIGVSADYLLGMEEIQSCDTIDKEINKRFGFSDNAIKALSHAVSNSKALKGKNLAVEALNILFTPYDDEAKEAGIPDLRFIWHLRDYLFTTTEDYKKAINKRMFNTAYGTEKVTTEDLEEISFNRVEKRLKFLRRLTQKRLEVMKLNISKKVEQQQTQIAETAPEREIEWDNFTDVISEVERLKREDESNPQ